MKNVQRLQDNLKYSYKARTQHKTKNKKEGKHKEKIGQNQELPPSPKASRAPKMITPPNNFQNPS